MRRSDSEPTVKAAFRDGPLKGRSVETAIVEGRPPSTVDAPAADGSTCRYCLEELAQSGSTAEYSFLYYV